MFDISQAVVEICDANNDGFIDIDEFKNLLREAEAAYVRKLFESYDLNMDGFVTQVFKYEFLQNCPPLIQMASIRL
mgnify:CR=1 FL=1